MSNCFDETGDFYATIEHYLANAERIRHLVKNLMPCFAKQ